MTIQNRRAFYNLDSDLRFLSANDVCLALWGKRREEIVGRRILEVFPDVEGSDSYEAHTHAMRSLRPFRKVLRSPVLDAPIDLEIHPSRAGLRVSFARVETRPSD